MDLLEPEEVIGERAEPRRGVALYLDRELRDSRRRLRPALLQIHLLEEAPPDLGRCLAHLEVLGYLFGGHSYPLCLSNRVLVGGYLDGAGVVERPVLHELHELPVEELLVGHPLVDVEELVDDVEVERPQRAVLEVVGPDCDVSVNVPYAHVHPPVGHEPYAEVAEHLIGPVAEDRPDGTDALEPLKVLGEPFEGRRRRVSVELDRDGVFPACLFHGWASRSPRSNKPALGFFRPRSH